MDVGKLWMIKFMRFLLLLMINLALAIPVYAQDGALNLGTNVYAAKFDCGKTSDDDDVVRGVYATSIDIHNARLVAVSFNKRVVVANREGDRPGEISAAKTDALAPGQAMRVDCQVIAGFLSH